jgi:hypothetical protein
MMGSQSSSYRRGRHGPGGNPSGGADRKNLDEDKCGLDLLQPFEIPQNRQSILCESLEKTSGNLEMFGKSLQAGKTGR